MSDPHMDRYQRAAQIWSVLVLAARNRQILSYKLVSKATGLPMQLGDFLGPIAAYCKVHGLPQLTVLVVNESGVPGWKYPGERPLYAEQAEVWSPDWLEGRFLRRKSLKIAGGALRARCIPTSRPNERRSSFVSVGVAKR